jgi:hypothetical protein
LLAPAYIDLSAAAADITVPRVMNAKTSSIAVVSVRAEGTMNNFQVTEEHGLVS